MKPIRLAAAVALLAWLAGCASAPPARFYTLMSEAPARPTAGPLAPAPRWTLLPVTVPAQVDQTQWVIRLPDDTLALLENDRWIAPLADEIRAALAERIRQDRPVLQQAQGWRIAVDVQRFESAPGRYARLEAEWTLWPGDGGAARLRCRSVYEEPAGASYAALAAAHRAALGRLGDALAAALQSLDAGSTAGCG
jgi:uncharacterized lipoprotein YmbA